MSVTGGVVKNIFGGGTRSKDSGGTIAVAQIAPPLRFYDVFSIPGIHSAHSAHSAPDDSAPSAPPYGKIRLEPRLRPHPD